MFEFDKITEFVRVCCLDGNPDLLVSVFLLVLFCVETEFNINCVKNKIKLLICQEYICIMIRQFCL